MYESKGDFEEICIINSLPSGALGKTHRENTKLYQSKKGKTRAMNLGYEHLIGWYARKI